MKSLKKALLAILVFVAMAAMTAFAGEGQWVFDGPEDWQWWYSYPDGSYPSNRWEQIDGNWYHFDKDGYMDVGWRNIDGNIYHLLDNGVMAANVDYETGRLGEDGAWIRTRPIANINVIAADDYAFWQDLIARYGINENTRAKSDDYDSVNKRNYVYTLPVDWDVFNPDYLMAIEQDYVLQFEDSVSYTYRFWQDNGNLVVSFEGSFV